MTPVPTPTARGATESSDVEFSAIDTFTRGERIDGSTGVDGSFMRELRLSDLMIRFVAGEPTPRSLVSFASTALGSTDSTRARLIDGRPSSSLLIFACTFNCRSLALPFFRPKKI
jgi:hypothetical protein